MATSLTSCEGIGLCDLTEEDLDMGDAFVETTSGFMNVISIVDQAMRNGDLQANGTATIDGANVNLTTDSLIVDYGATNVMSDDGKYRRGKIKAALTGDYFQSQGSVSAVLSNYYVDDVPVTGDFSMGNQGQSSNIWTLNLLSTNFAIGSEYQYSANLLMEWESGYETQDSIADDKFALSGAATGADLVDSVDFSTTFTAPMKFDRSCDYLVTQGIVDVVLTNGTGEEGEVATVTVDFIDSDMCNNILQLNAACGETEVSFPQNFDGF